MKIMKEKVPGKLVSVGILMMIFSAIHLTLILLLLLIPFLVSWIIDLPVESMSDMLVGWMNSTGGSADPGPITISIMTGVAYLFLTLMIIYFSLMMAYGIGFIRGRLTKRPPYYLAVLTFISVILPFWGAVVVAAKIIIGILMIVAFKDERVQMLYQRANDPEWELKIPPVIQAPLMPPRSVVEKEVVNALVLD